MNKVRSVGVRAGPPSTKKISHAAAANIGIKKGNHSSTSGKPTQRRNDPIVTGRPAQVPSGNAVALNVGRGGPGTGRTVSPSGSQGTHGGDGRAPNTRIFPQSGGK
jgi:hypothetical protein